jgi:hypothetical protein
MAIWSFNNTIFYISVEITISSVKISFSFLNQLSKQIKLHLVFISFFLWPINMAKIITSRIIIRDVTFQDPQLKIVRLHFQFFSKDNLCLDSLFWEYILQNTFLLECILENTFSRMHFAENSAFGKILKLFIKSDYTERNCV